MSWRKPTEDDLVATLSQREAEAFSRSASFAAEPVAILLVRTAEWARGYIRRNGSVTLCPDGGTLPEGCISPAMDYAASDVLKRMAIPLNEDRRKARQEAIAFFEAVAANKVTPESFGGDETGESPVAASPTSAPATPSRLLD